MDSTGPALPWADNYPQHQHQSTASAAEGPNLRANDRIEVRWHVTGEEGKVATRWWGATLESRKDKQPLAWVLRYDAMDGFEEELEEVTFLPQDGSVLHWRKPGDAVEYPSDGEDDSDVVDLSELTAEQEALERTLGQTIEQAALQHMQAHLDLTQQQAVAAGFRTFADHFVSQLRERSRASGDYVVTAEDVADIVGKFKEK